MNFIFSCHENERIANTLAASKFAIIFPFFLFALSPFVVRLHAQTNVDSVTEFRRAVQGLSAARLEGAEESESQMEKTVSYLDSIAIAALNASAAPDLQAVNRQLAGLVSHTPPVGENYRLLKLGGDSPVYALVINFGLGGPGAIRIYAGAAGHFAMAARIDHFIQKDFFDSDLELVPVSSAAPAFVVVAGRTDDLATGMFSAWLFGGTRLAALWTSDLLQQSAYEADENGFHLAYCSQVDEDHPSQCLRMSRDLYRLQEGKWERVESVSVAPSEELPK
jgi:hypothetical protein